MPIYHLNSNGNPGICKVKSGNCPFADNDDHYNSKEEAREAYERDQQFELLAKSTSKSHIAELEKN